jgi:hypothetical protein
MKASAPAIAWGLVALGIVLLPACTRGTVRKEESVGNATIAVATIPLTSPAPQPAKRKTAYCPAGMVLVEGEYCPDVDQKCLEWMDPPSSPYHNFRCARYEKPAKCKVPRVHKRYCIDATERVEDGTNLPRHFMSWTSSKKLCEAEGARLCLESEWIFACEGEEMRPYPYGWERDSSACNVDISKKIDPKCASPFGVQDMSGNVEEWTQADGKSKMGWKEVLKGSWWIPSRHACRQFQVGHNDTYAGAETGTRCCKDPPPQVAAAEN